MLRRRNLIYGLTESLADFAITKICKWILMLCIVSIMTTSNDKYWKSPNSVTVIFNPFVTSSIAAIACSTDCGRLGDRKSVV